ncbi:MAG: HAD family phosphatase [Planctomycetota bacterium]|nr:MAG: HAD family phosphatase [Planctomycetota bacterium]REJ95747.1 MAG: HAD family phosphatase [Planctomycetota bacterium]
MPPEFIYFDLGNVLLTFSRERQYAQLAEVAGVAPDVVREALEGRVHDAAESGTMSTAEVYEQFCTATGTRPDAAALQRAGNDIFHVNVPMLPLLSQLRRSGRRMGVLSNTSESHWKFITDGRYRILPNYFEIAILSYEVGAMKPDAKIYAAAAEAVGVPPEKIFFMDDREENVVGAREFGLDAVLYTDTPALVAELTARGVALDL